MHFSRSNTRKTTGFYFLVISAVYVTAAASDVLEALARSSAESLKSNLGEGGQWLEELTSLTKLPSLPVKSRQKRILPVELPRGLIFELKWNIDFPIYTFARFGMDLQLAILNDMFYPREFVALQEDMPLVDLIPEEFKPYVLKPPRLINKDEFFGEDYEEEEEMERRRYQILHRKKREASRDREVLYRVLEKYINEYGLPGGACLLRTFCELAEVPLQNDLFGQLVTAIFRPSRGTPHSTGDTYDAYLTAELHGLSRQGCAVSYGDCPASLFDVLPFFEHNFVY